MCKSPRSSHISFGECSSCYLQMLVLQRRHSPLSQSQPWSQQPTTKFQVSRNARSLLKLIFYCRRFVQSNKEVCLDKCRLVGCKSQLICFCEVWHPGLNSPKLEARTTAITVSTRNICSLCSFLLGFVLR